jgi:hypothetical protein
MAANALSDLRSVRPAVNFFTTLADTTGALPPPGGAATALCDLVARRRRNAPRPGKTLKKSQTDNSIYAGM